MKKQIEKVENTPRLSVMTGGRGPDGTLWLEELANGEAFLASKKNEHSAFVPAFMKNATKREFTQLLELPSGAPVWVETIAFCRDYDYRLELYIPKEDEGSEEPLKGEP